MRHAWPSREEFLWALGVFLTRYAEDFDEPIPWPNYESAIRAADSIASINEPVFGRRRYRSLSAKLAALVYELCKQHFFLHGNKRIAYFFLLYALTLNRKQVDIPTFEERAALMEAIADSDPAQRKYVLRQIRTFLDRNIQPLTLPPVTAPNSN